MEGLLTTPREMITEQTLREREKRRRRRRREVLEASLLAPWRFVCALNHCSLLRTQLLKMFRGVWGNGPMLHTENVASGGKLSFQNVGVAKVYTMH